MIKIEKRAALAPARKAVGKQIAQLRQEIEELSDYLDLLEARAANAGKRRYTTAQVRKEIGLA